MTAGSLTAARDLPVATAQRPALAVDCVRDAAGLRALGDAWRALQRDGTGLTPFNSFEWAWSWWQAYGAGRALRVLVFRAGDAVVGIAPLYLARERPRLGPRCRVLRLVGDGSYDSDDLGFVVRPGAEEAVLARFCAWLDSERDWDVLALRELQERSALPAALEAYAARARLSLRVEHTPCAVLDLPESFDAFLRARQSRFRTRLRSLLRRVDDGEVAFETGCAPRELRARLRSLYRLHQARWQAAGSPGVFGAAAKRVFYAHFVPRFARNGWLRLYSLRRGDTYVAHQLCFGTGGVTYLLQEGFDVADPAASYGQALRAAVIRHLIEQRETTYDFLGGFSRHKDDWGAREGRMVHVLLARRTLRGQLHFRLPLWRERGAALAKRVLPAALVARLRGARR